jgi:hypothetical protein
MAMPVHCYNNVERLIVCEFFGGSASWELLVRLATGVAV